MSQVEPRIAESERRGGRSIWWKGEELMKFPGQEVCADEQRLTWVLLIFSTIIKQGINVET